MPANFVGLRQISAETQHVAVSRILGCECGSEEVKISATYVGGDLPFLDPISFECSACGSAAVFFDSKRDGFDGRLNGGACYEQGTQPTIVACSNCKGTTLKLQCALLYNNDFEDEGDTELLAKAEDYFDAIDVNGFCSKCGATTHIGAWELS